MQALPQLPLKRMFDVFVMSDDSRKKALIVLADDEAEARALIKISITDVFAYPGFVSAIGQSRVIGWTLASPFERTFSLERR